MPQTSICRMCLVTDIRMITIAGTPLQAVYEKITDAELLDNMKPIAACYICHALLQRCQTFMEKSAKAEEVLSDFLMNNKLTIKSVAGIDRDAYKLTHSLTSKLLTSEILLEADDQKDIKKEMEFEFAGDEVGCYEDQSDYPQLNEPVLQITEKTVDNPSEGGFLEITFLKEENKGAQELNDDSDMDNRDVESEDDQPLRPAKPAAKRKRADSGDWKPAKKAPSEKKAPTERKAAKKAPGKAKKRGVPNVQMSEEGEFMQYMSLEHVKIKNRRRYKCQFCQKLFVNKSHMRGHLRTHTGEKPFECVHCFASFSRVYHLKRHMRTHTSEAPYACSYCFRRFKREDNLKTHLKTHIETNPVTTEKIKIETDEHSKDYIDVFEDIKPYVCKECGSAFKGYKEFKLHSVLHTGQPVFECDYCRRNFVRKRDLRVHVVKHLNHTKHECDVCRLKFSTESMLEEHLKMHTEEVHVGEKFTCKTESNDDDNKKRYQCGECGARFARNYRLKRHLLVHEGEPGFECIFCHCKFNQKNILRMHLKTHTGKTELKCKVCRRRFSDEGKLEKHMKKHVEGTIKSIYDLKPFLCNQCGTRFSRRYHLNRHIQTHNSGTVFECPFCPNKYSEKNSLKTHIKIHAYDKRFECDACNQKFVKKVSLIKHLAQHNKKESNAIENKSVKKRTTDTEPIKCNVCGLVVNRKYDYKRHVLLHTGEKPHECKICQKRFTQTGSLRAHLKRHSGIKPFECTICQHKFYEKNNLVTHMTKHSDVKPHECNVCNRRFKRKDVMAMHQQLHTGERPHECHICLRRFALKKTMKKHLNTHKADKVEIC